jgi:predicted extracellular nuclease
VLASLAGLTAAVTGLALTPLAPADAVSGGLVISEVYGGGGNAGATYTNDFVELYNPTAAAISVTGMSVQYRSSGNGGTGVTALSGSVPAGGHYLVQEAAGTGGTTPLPAPDATGNLGMSGTAGIVFLSTQPTAVTLTPGGAQQGGSVVDLVGFGSAATVFETAPTPTLSNATSAARSAGDTDSNAADFAVGAPTPQNSATTPPPPEPPAEFEGPIAEIQGADTDTSPHVDDIATTQGVVTAAYPTGGFNGFYIQTSGTGGATDATPGASDAVFVYGSAVTAVVKIGDAVEVTGEVQEFNGTTEIVPAAASGVTVLDDAPAAASVTPLAAPFDAIDTAEEKEAHEGELLAPQGDFVVSDNYDTNYYASFTLAAGDTPLVQPTDVVPASDTAGIAAIQAENVRRSITLDDGASTNFNSTANKGTPLPWLTPTNPARIGSAVDFHAPLVLEYRNSLWNLQPTTQVTDEGSAVATFENTRTAAPEQVGGDIRLATFNVLNYFNTTGEDYVASGGACTYFKDRAGTPITNDTCTPNGPRGAATAASLERQQAKIVAAINGLGASIVSLEEIENSVALGEADRDDALSTLVDALNTAAGSDVWAFAPSPAPEDLPATGEQDVIRTAFIYKPAHVSLVGASRVLTGSPAFANAREPLAQAFKATGAPDTDAFAVIVNHFKSKGDSKPAATGDNAETIQGAFNGDRVRQAHALSAFADDFAASVGTDAVFLTGDFNSYTQEDPLQALYADGYDNLESTTDPEETTYSFDGLAGSLDHVLANPAAEAMVTGVDIWNINADESIAYEYSRYNYNATLLYEANPYRASDHDPEVVGLDLPAIGPVASTVTADDVTVVHGKEVPRIPVTVTADGVTPTGTVTVLDGSEVLGDATLTDGSAVVVLPKNALKRGVHTLTVSYSGDDAVAPGSTTVTVLVTNRGGK